MTELQEPPDCREDEEPRELRVKTATPALPAVTGRTDCPDPEVCQARTDWMATRDLQELRDCRDLRDLPELPGLGAGLATRERPDLREVSGCRDPPVKTAATARPDLLGRQV